MALDAYAFYFDRKNEDFDFLPGQYIRMMLSISNPDERGNSRLFSIVSSPLEKDYLMITTRIIQSSFKQELVKLPEGSMVKFFGPMGKFTLTEDEMEPRVFLAGGIGITPFHSMIRYVAQKNLPVSIYLFVSFSTIKELIFYKELSQIAIEKPNIKIIYTITHPKESQDNWQGEIGRISDTLIKKYVLDIQKPIYYIAGPPKMVEAMVLMVSQMGISADKIRKENFSGY